MTPTTQTLTDDALVKVVKDAYSLKAKEGSDVECMYFVSHVLSLPLFTTSEDSNRVAHAFGYTPEQLQSIPAESHMGLSCGNPVAAASLKPVRMISGIFSPESTLIPKAIRESASWTLGPVAALTSFLLQPRLAPRGVQLV
jgi:hypothetical protein